MTNQFTTRSRTSGVSVKAPKNTATFLMLWALLFVLAACTESEPSGVIKSDGIGGGVVLDFSAPDQLRNSRAVDATAVSLEVTVNGRRVQLEPGGDQWIGAMTVSRGSNLRIVATWSESFNGSLLELAQAGQDYTVPVNPDREIIVRFVASDYFTGFDKDSDGISNLAERNAGSDPENAEPAADPIVFVPVLFNGALPARLVEASNDLDESLFAVVEINRTSVLLSREADQWIGETTFPTNTDVLVNFIIYSSANRDVPLARWQNTRNVGSGITISVAAGDYGYDEFNSDGDEKNNIQEILDGTNPLDKSDPPPDLCAVSNFNQGCLIDTDGDDKPDSIESETADADGDSVPDYLESSKVDDDGDGFNAEQDSNENDPCIPSPNTTECSIANPPPDGDGDGVADADDNCVAVANPNQDDADGDGIGDACEVVVAPDGDGDGVADADDNCIAVANPDQDDSDGDGIGDACEVVVAPDTDGDGVADADDNCIAVANPDQDDSDGDGIGDACEVVVAPDGDGDGVADADDNCIAVANPDQDDSDGDGIGDACEVVVAPDGDGDGVADEDDNCIAIANPDQEDTDEDGVGDACEVEDTDEEPITEIESSELLYEYYEGRWPLLPDFSTLTPVRTGTSATFTLPPNNGVLFYGLRFTGQLNVTEAGAYTFYTASNDGTKLYIDGTLVVDNDGSHTLIEESGDVTLTAGLRDITLEYFQAGGTEDLEVSWSGSGLSKQIISDEVLFAP